MASKREFKKEIKHLRKRIERLEALMEQPRGYVWTAPSQPDVMPYWQQPQGDPMGSITWWC